jgi:6-phosphogluconolactonase
VSETHLQVFPTVAVMSQAAADLFARTVVEAVAKRDRFLAALSGGNTPVPFFRLLSRPPYHRRLPWEKMHFFWADERCVPPDDPQSNYGQALAKWLVHVPVPRENLHRIKGELGSPPAVRNYRTQLKDFAEGGHPWPRFDFVLLGLGADGHTASLFPGTPAEMRPARSAIPAIGNYRGRPAERISLTPSVFDAARLIVFLVSGEEKAEAVAATRTGPSDPVRWPGQRIRPKGGKVVWLIDEAAACLLRK